MKNIAVFCGSHLGRNTHFEEAARTLGDLLASQGLTLVYGGSNLGYMGTVSSAALARGGQVIGVIPSLFSPEVIHSQPVSQLIIVASMAERKQQLADLSDAFIALPGGVGTLDEVTEMLTNNQLGLARKPIAILNTDGFYDPLLLQLQRMHEEGFIATCHYQTILSASTPQALLQAVLHFE